MSVTSPLGQTQASCDPIPLSKPVIGVEEEVAVLSVIRSGQLSLGPKLGEFEKRFARRLGVKYASAVSSGTAGLHLALRSVGVQAGDEVITSPFSFVASANAIEYQRAKPVFIDIDPLTLNINPDAAADAVNSRTKAFLPVHIFGYPAETANLERHGLAIVEDACEALGACHRDGIPVGGRGHPAVFAFYANKQLTTGEGGMVVTNQFEQKIAIDSERNQGRSPNMDWLDHDRLGYNYRLNELSCALGIVQLDRLDDLLTRRAQVANLYRQALSHYVEELDITLPCEDGDGVVRGWFVFVIQLAKGIKRDAVIESLKTLGIQTKPYLPAIHLLSYYREKYGFKQGQFPVCEDVSQRSIALPFFPEMDEGQVGRVVDSLIIVLREISK